MAHCASRSCLAFFAAMYRQQTQKGRNDSPAPKARAAAAHGGGTSSYGVAKPADSEGANFSKAMGEGSLFPIFALTVLPFFCQLLAFISADERLSAPTLSAFVEYCSHEGWQQCMLTGVTAASPFNIRAWVFLGSFMLLARVLYDNYPIPAPTKCGPMTGTGHVPTYVENGMTHCVLFSVCFFAGSHFVFGFYDFGIIYDVIMPLMGVLNVFGLAFCLVLYVKGLYFPSTQDCGSSGSFIIDYYWGTELYPRILGVDVKLFVNCRFSMTFWMLSGLSYAYRSSTMHGVVDYGLLLSAVSQYLYLCKFFAWEIGYMRSIDIIVDRAGFYETWGCLVFVPSLYTLHTRLLVRSPSQLSFATALAIFAVGLTGVLLNFWADKQREWFRETDGKIKIWGKAPEFVKATYTIVEDGKKITKSSLLLASGFWGVARHFHYIFELTAAWSWCLLANPMVNGVLPLAYCVFLTILLFDRAKRDEEKCLKKYGADYQKYSELVPYLIIPGIY